MMPRPRFGASLATLALLSLAVAWFVADRGDSVASRAPKPSVSREHKALLAFTRSAVSKGILYVVGANGLASGTGGSHYVYALRASTGKLVWRYKTGSSFSDTPLIANGTVYAGSNKLYALNAATGRLRWSFHSPVDTPPALAGSVLIVCSADGHVYGLKASSGAELWQLYLNPLTRSIGSVVSPNPPAVADGTVFITDDSGYVVAVNPATGHTRWTYAARNSMFGSPAVAGGIVYAAAYDEVFAIRASNRKKVWSFRAAGNVAESTPATAGGRVFIGSMVSRVYALNARTGALSWTFKTLGRHGCTQTYSPLVSGGYVYVGSDDFNLYALRASTGKQVWRFHARNEVASVTAAGGSVYAWSLDGNEYSLNAKTGRKQWAFHIGGKFPGVCIQA